MKAKGTAVTERGRPARIESNEALMVLAGGPPALRYGEEMKCWICFFSA